MSDDTQKRPLTAIRPTEAVQALMTSISSGSNRVPPVIMICGPKGTGKSTLSRLLINACLTRNFAKPGVGFLDLDPGQPEYSPPGEVSLFHINNLNLGPPFSHPMILDECTDSLIRSHHIGASSPKDDTIHYLSCVLDLLDSYDRRLHIHGCPLVINCSGWVQGAGIDSLEAIIQNGRINHVVFMGAVGPEQSSHVLRVCSEAMGAVFHQLSTQPSLPTIRKAANMRMMQTLSYFHSGCPEGHNMRWDETPLYAKEPMCVSYTSPRPDIMGIMILGEEINPDMLADIINGSVLALVAVEDPSELLRYIFQLETTPENGNKLGPEMNTSETMNGVSETSSWKYEFNDLHDYRTMSLHGLPLTKEGIPYLFNGFGTNTPLDPRKTRSIGQVLIRAIDSRNKKLQILTPVLENTILSYRARGVPLVLVRGGLDIPVWSYQEEYFTTIAINNDLKRWSRYKLNLALTEENESDTDREANFDVEAWAARTPWIERVKSNERGRRKDKVWKVRRNMKIKNKKIKN